MQADESICAQRLLIRTRRTGDNVHTVNHTTHKQGVSVYVLMAHKEPLPGQRCSDAARHAQARLMGLPHAPGRIHVRSDTLHDRLFVCTCGRRTSPWN